MSSTEYGESLLAGVRKRNDQREKEYRSRAKKNAWKELGVRAAIGLGKSMIEQRQEQFLNNEQNIASKLKISNATDTATRYTTTEANANAFTGGRDLYFQGLAAPQVKSFMESEYASGTYNQTQYDLLEKQLTAKYGKALDEQHRKGLEKTNAFLKTTGGDKGAYLAALKREKPGTASAIIGNFIGSKTGIIKTDLHNSTSNMLDTAEELKTYQSTYAATGDSAISSFVAREGLLDDVDLGTKAPTYSEVKTRKGPLGEEVSYMTQTSYNKEGVVSGVREIFADATTGQFMFNTPESSRVVNNFNVLSSRVQTATDKTYFEAGKNALTGMSAEDLEVVQDAAKEKINQTHKSTSKVGQQMLESVNDNLAGQVGAIIYTGKTEGWATSRDAAIIGQHMIKKDAQNPGTRVMSGVGFNNPYHTMFAMSDAIDAQQLNITDGFTDIGTKSLSGLYNAYRSETTPGRAAIEAKLKETNYFEGKTGETFKQFHTVVKTAIEEGKAGTDENLAAIYMRLYKPNPLDADMNEDTGVMDAAIPAPVSVSGRLKLPANLENATDTTRRSAASQYKAILSAEKKFLALSEKLAPQTRTDVTPQAMEIINARNASKLAKEKAKLDNRIKVYVNMYGEKATPEMLEDFDDQEKELYFSTGTLPDRHTPAV